MPNKFNAQSPGGGGGFWGSFLGGGSGGPAGGSPGGGMPGPGPGPGPAGPPPGPPGGPAGPPTGPGGIDFNDPALEQRRMDARFAMAKDPRYQAQQRMQAITELRNKLQQLQLAGAHPQELLALQQELQGLETNAQLWAAETADKIGRPRLNIGGGSTPTPIPPWLQAMFGGGGGGIQ